MRRIVFPISTHGSKITGVLLAMFASLVAFTACAAEIPRSEQRVFIIGQDLDSIREYYASDCCPDADGATAYLSFYNLLIAGAGYGGLGIDGEGRPLDLEHEWGAGGANARKTALEFPGGLAIGLSITENEHPGALDRLVSGEYDANIEQLARFLKLIDVPVWLRIGYEFDGGWNTGYENKTRYIAAWRHIVDGLRRLGVEQVEYVWQSAASPLNDLDGFRKGEFQEWYPGDDYVDWIGLSYFLPLDESPRVEVQTMPRTAGQIVGELLEFARNRGKPVMIAEATPQGYDLADPSKANITFIWDGEQAMDRQAVTTEHIWEAWFAPLFNLMHENPDVIRGLAYINCHWDSQDMWNAPYESGYWGDSRLQVQPDLAQWFSEAIHRWKNGE